MKSDSPSRGNVPRRRIGRWLQLGAGASTVLVGVALITGIFAMFSFWPLRTIPAFAINA
jgi:hypothetical protein